MAVSFMTRLKKYNIHLSEEEREKLKAVIRKKLTSKTIRVRCQIILDLDDAHGKVLTHEQSAKSNGACIATVTNTVRKYIKGGIDAVTEFKRSINSDNARRKVDGFTEGLLISLACCSPPKGRARWTLSLLQEKAKEIMKFSLSIETIRRTLVKNKLRPHKIKYWCNLMPSEEFRIRMEILLTLYALIYNKKRPVVCMDEKPYQLLGDARKPKPMIPGSDKKVDSEYVRNGHVSIFSFVEPLGGVHYASVRERRTAVDWAEEIKYLVDVMYPNAEKIVLVMDNLNTHRPESLYKRYSPEEAERILKKLEIHYTPKHASWLNIAEIELNAMTRQCLSRRIDNIDKLRTELAAWVKERNQKAVKIKWHFTTKDAKRKLRSLYPEVTDLKEDNIDAKS